MFRSRYTFFPRLLLMLMFLLEVILVGVTTVSVDPRRGGTTISRTWLSSLLTVCVHGLPEFHFLCSESRS